MAVFCFAYGPNLAVSASSSSSPWPEIHRETRPWAYWWWMGSAVDQTNLTRELQRYHDAGLGGVHIIPIYGAKGYEGKFIDFLSPKWMEMLAYTVREGQRLDLGVDMTMGTGWCFGGPQVTDLEANARVVVKTFEAAAGILPSEKIDPKATQAAIAFSTSGSSVDLTDKIEPDGSIHWSPPEDVWKVYAISQRPSGQKVKRAAPGGQGNMLNLVYPEAMQHYLRWFDAAFANYTGPKPRALYHDSYEYRSDWSPDFFTQFEHRRGYRLQTELPALFADDHVSRFTYHVPRFTEPDHIARVKSDYRETISEVMSGESLPEWISWAHAHGFITRNEAHGSPGNWLDLYAAADIPETEMFHLDRNKLISKFASSAAHVAGKKLVAAETGTWLTEHFTETLADMKFLLDDMFLSGINHVFYHGTCYSPDEAGWPGWVFYASYEMNPRNAIWHDVPTLNAYAARCQAVLQSGQPDNDLLLYWPIHDLWHNPVGLVQPLTIHARDWFEAQPMGRLAEQLWKRGYAFDYVSDRQLATAKTEGRSIVVPGGHYRVIVVPKTEHIPVETMRQLLDLARSGASVVFETELPKDVPGLGQLENRRDELKRLCAEVLKWETVSAPVAGRFGRGWVRVGDVEQILSAAGVRRESMFEQPGLMCVRRATPHGLYYFIANRSEQGISDWVPLGTKSEAVTIMDPLTGRSGLAAIRHASSGTEVFLQVQPGGSLVLDCEDKRVPTATPGWSYLTLGGSPVGLAGVWHCKFVQGGPELPAEFETRRLASWTEVGDSNAQRFAGSAVYTIEFAAPQAKAKDWQLDLGKVSQSAHVRLNGRDLGTLITPPYRVDCGALRTTGNKLEVEVTNTSANRIRDLDRRGVQWKHFYDINMVDLNYKPFDASNWPVAEAGLLGPVTLTPMRKLKIEN